MPQAGRKQGVRMKVLRKQREQLGLSRAALARRAEINGSQYSLIERGRFIPYPVQLLRIADALGWEGEPEELLEEVTVDE